MKEKIQHQPFQGWLSLIKQRRLSISSPSLKDFKCNFVVVMPLNAISCPIFPIKFQLISKSLEVIMTLNAILLWILVMLFLYTLSLPFFLIINFIRLILNLCVQSSNGSLNCIPLYFLRDTPNLHLTILYLSNLSTILSLQFVIWWCVYCRKWQSNSIKHFFNRSFKIKDLCNLKYFLAIEVVRSKIGTQLPKEIHIVPLYREKAPWL